jgi:hypothetical protein
MNSLIVFFFIAYGIYAFFYNMRFWYIYLSLLGAYYYLTQVRWFNDKFNYLRRKVSIATWGAPYDPQTYAKLKLDITKMESYLEIKGKEIGEKLTLTIFVIKLISIVLKKYPELYGYIKFGKVIILNQDVSKR